MMGVTHTGYATNETYASLATKARQNGVVPCEAELFRRMLFNCFVHNTDDHLRNHGFLRDGARWRLSPGFDLVPDRRERLVLAPAKGILPVPDPLVTFASYPAFGLSREEALVIYGEIADGMAAVGDTLDAYEVSRTDREVLAARWAKVYSPPAQSALPGSLLVRPSRPPGKAQPKDLRSSASCSTRQRTRQRKQDGPSRLVAGTPSTSTTLPARQPGSGTPGPLVREWSFSGTGSLWHRQIRTRRPRRRSGTAARVRSGPKREITHARIAMLKTESERS